MMAEQFKMVQYIDIVTKNIIRVILRENQYQCTININAHNRTNASLRCICASSPQYVCYFSLFFLLFIIIYN